MKYRAAFILSTLLVVTAPSWAPPLYAQFSTDTQPGAVCPLSDPQQDKAVRTFAGLEQMIKSSPPRCINCHGALQPFAAGTTHPGGRLSPFFTKGKLDGPKTKQAQCILCHDPPWQAPNQDDFWIDKDAVQLCQHFRGQFKTPQAFLNHLRSDPLADLAYLGMRALNDNGQLISESELGKPPKPEPPSFDRPDLLLQAGFWIDAQDGKFQGDTDCGCKPHHYLLRIVHDVIASLPAPLLGELDLHQDLKIPVKFEDDGSFSGQQTVDINRTWNITIAGMPCKETLVVNQELWQFRGKPGKDATVFDITLSQGRPNGARVTIQCGGGAGGGGSAFDPMGSKDFQISGFVNDPKTFDFSVPPYVSGRVTLTWIDEIAP